MAKNRLTLEEQALADATTLMQRVRELTVQAQQPRSVDPASRKMIATEVRSRARRSCSTSPTARTRTANTCSPGYSTLTQPFAQTGGTVVTYFGDQGARLAADRLSTARRGQPLGLATCS